MNYSHNRKIQHQSYARNSILQYNLPKHSINYCNFPEAQMHIETQTFSKINNKIKEFMRSRTICSSINLKSSLY
nr:hypothetical protein Itr_chr03CG15470 [Ipomoea trifida]